MDNNKKQEEQTKPKMREVIIQFDNDNIRITKAEISSNWELQAILSNLLNSIQNRNTK